MSKQVIVIDLGSLLDFNRSIFDTIRPASKVSAIEVIQKFQENQLTKEEFITELQTFFPKLSQQQLAEKWTAIRSASKEHQRQLQELEALSSAEQPIHFFWHVDALQCDCIQNLNNCYYSCNFKTSNPCDDFIQTLQEQYGQVPVTVFSCQTVESNVLLSRLRVPIDLHTMSICSNLVTIQNRELSKLKNYGCAIVYCQDIEDLYSKVEEKIQEPLIKDFSEKTQLVFSEPSMGNRRRNDLSVSLTNDDEQNSLSTSPIFNKSKLN